MLLLGGACAVLLLMPWQGPIILSLSWSHGIHAGDLAALPLFALALGYLQANDGWRAARWSAGRWAVSANAVLLGALLVLGGVGASLIGSSSGSRCYRLAAGRLTAAPYMPMRDGLSR